MQHYYKVNSFIGFIMKEEVVNRFRYIQHSNELFQLMEEVSAEIGFRFWALIHHDDLLPGRLDRVDMKRYPDAATERLFVERHYRRDPIVRGSLYAGGAFIWSQINRIMTLDRHDRAAFALGAQEGLNEGITVPYMILGECPGSCTFAGMQHPEKAEHVVGLAQMIGIFAFQAARRLTGSAPVIKAPQRLYPRIRDCIMMAGRGCSNKEIARALGITPRTVDGYMTEAYQLFEVHGRTELVVSAVLTGDVGLHELKPRQSG